MATFDDERSYQDGDIIVAEGDPGTEMFVIQSGRVRVTKQTAEGEVVLATLDRGDFFGEMSLLESLPRIATVRAVGPTRLVAIRSGELLMKIRRDPTFAFELLQRLSTRVRALDEEIARLTAATPKDPRP